MNMKRNKFLPLLIIISAFFLLGGCSAAGLDAQALMMPPTSNLDQQAIQQLLAGDKSNVTYIYPKNGDYRSAIIMQSFTEEDSKDAIGFVLLETGGIEVKFLSCDNDGVWRTVSSFKNSATQVDSVYFGDLSGNGVNNIVVGWGNTQNNMSAAMSVYSYQHGRVTEIQAERPYGAVTLADFNGNGIFEIFSIHRPVQADGTNESKPASAEILSLQEGKLVSTAFVEADSSIVKYNSIKFGKINTDQFAVVLDGSKADGSMTTQIFHLGETGRLINLPVGTNSETAVSPLFRPVGTNVVSCDINGDGMLEFPSATLLPAIKDTANLDSTSFLVQWQNLNIKSIEYTLIDTTLVNTAENYIFSVPDELIGNITAINNPQTKTVTYYTTAKQDGSDEALLNSALFTIRVFTKSSWEQRGLTSGYEILMEKDDTIYGISYQKNDTQYKVALRQIINSFRTYG